jgi:hypothetical protein
MTVSVAVLTAVTQSDGPPKATRSVIICMVWTWESNLQLSDSAGLAVRFGIANELLKR